MQTTTNEDGKYFAKYKHLKQKLKDIELDNDRLQLKVLKTKKNIQRLRIERAILYERLSSMPLPPISVRPSPPPPSSRHHLPFPPVARPPPPPRPPSDLPLTLPPPPPFPHHLQYDWPRDDHDRQLPGPGLPPIRPWDDSDSLQNGAPPPPPFPFHPRSHHHPPQLLHQQQQPQQPPYDPRPPRKLPRTAAPDDDHVPRVQEGEAMD